MIKKSLLLLLIVCGGILGGLFVMISGIIPIKASSGHWEVTEMILKYSMSRSVSTYSHFNPEIEIDLEGYDEIERAAGHYEIGCRGCHGAPGDRSAYLGGFMTAPAPYLPDTVGKWDKEELFTIIKHGVKFTGMPHWPDLERNDEVRSMVQLIQKFPTISREVYDDYVHISEAPDKFQKCLDCHAHSQLSSESLIPSLAGQSEAYLQRSLEDYRKKERSSGTMQLVASGLSDEEITEYARYFKNRGAKQISPVEKSEPYLQGEEIALRGIPERRIAACSGCHGPQWTTEGKNPEYPRLIGLSRAYIDLQLQLFQLDKRGSGKFTRIMKKALGEHLTKEERRAVSAYYELVPRPLEGQE